MVTSHKAASATATASMQMHSEPDEQLGNLTPELACFSARGSGGERL
jgi:hypothetical protein